MWGSALDEQDGGVVHNLISLGRGGIPPNPPFRHALTGTILFFGGIWGCANFIGAPPIF